jgi:hypothetical protein
MIGVSLKTCAILFLLFSLQEKLVTRLFREKLFFSLLLFFLCTRKLWKSFSFLSKFLIRREIPRINLNAFPNSCFNKVKLNSMKARKNTKDRCARVQECLYELRHFILLDDGLVFYTFSFKLAFDFRE